MSVVRKDIISGPRRLSSGVMVREKGVSPWINRNKIKESGGGVLRTESKRVRDEESKVKSRKAENKNQRKRRNK